MADSSLIIDKLKTYLKIKQVTYKQLARGLDVSEPTVKRWFSTGNISLKQLDEVCVHLDTSLSEIISLEQKEISQEYFSLEQEKAFNANEKLLILFYLVSSGLSADNIMKNYNFSIKDISRLANKLDSLGLVDFLPNNKFRSRVSVSTLWSPSGLLSKKYFHLIRNDFMNTYFTNNEEDQWFFYGRLTLSNYNVIQKKIDQLAVEIKELYKIDRKEVKAPSRSLFIGIRPWDFDLVKRYRR